MSSISGEWIIEGHDTAHWSSKVTQKTLVIGLQGSIELKTLVIIQFTL